MDADRFDTLTRGVFASTTRRRTLGTLLGTLALGVTSADAKRKQKKTRRKRKRKQRKNKPCYPGTSCTLGQEKANAGCDFSQSTTFVKRDIRGSNLSRTNLTGAQLAGADLRGVDLRGACLVSANLLDAKIDDSTNLEGAILCRTLMPTGETDDSGCESGTSCCPTVEACNEDQCNGECINTPDVVCSILGTPCCPGMFCAPTIYSPFVTTCEMPCSSTEQCVQRFGEGYHCGFNPEVCLYIGNCCNKTVNE
jgi:hypothetical protein